MVAAASDIQWGRRFVSVRRTVAVRWQMSAVEHGRRRHSYAHRLGGCFGGVMSTVPVSCARREKVMKRFGQTELRKARGKGRVVQQE